MDRAARTVVAITLVAGLASGGSDARAQSRAVQQAQEYAQQHNFSVKQVTAGPANRQVRRMVVPITPQSYTSFLTRFNADKGFVHFNFNSGNNHMALGMKPPGQDGKATDCYLWARNYNGKVQGIGDYRNMYAVSSPNGYCLAVDLQGPRIQHLATWLKARANPQDNLYRQGNCMEWLPNAEVAPSKPLFHELGIRRSRDGRNMKAKMVHAANKNLEVVGVFVPDVNTFNTMTNEQLLGPPPSGGIPDAAR